MIEIIIGTMEHKQLSLLLIHDIDHFDDHFVTKAHGGIPTVGHSHN
jgi:hypothetical protein